MKKIYVLYDHTAFTYRWLSTLIWAKKEFDNNGYQIVFPSIFKGLFSKPNIEKELKHIKGHFYDYVFIAIHPSTVMMKYFSTNMHVFLEKIKNTGAKIIWLDTSDSAGTPMFEVLPYVDKYLKKQIYSKLEDYCIKYYDDRKYSDYYHTKFGIVGSLDCKTNSIILDKKYINKIGISWNVGLSMFLERKKIQFFLNINRRKKIKHIKFQEIKKYDVYFSGSSFDASAYFQRKLCKEKLKNLKQWKMPSLDFNTSLKKYKVDIRFSKTMISPYGWGEICYRDFEAFMSGAVLLKPDMNGIKTYPDFYHDYKSYVPLNWDLSNIDDVIKYLSDNKEKANEIVSYAQNLFLEEYNNGKEKFVKHILKEIETLNI